MKSPLLLYSMSRSPSQAHKPQHHKKKKRCTSALSFHVPAYPRCSEKYEKRRTAQMVKNKDFPAAAAAAATPPPQVLKLFFFFLFCRGNVPLISHQSQSPPWPCSVILKSVIITQQKKKNSKTDCSCVKMITAISHPFCFYNKPTHFITEYTDAKQESLIYKNFAIMYFKCTSGRKLFHNLNPYFPKTLHATMTQRKIYTQAPIIFSSLIWVWTCKTEFNLSHLSFESSSPWFSCLLLLR